MTGPLAALAWRLLLALVLLLVLLLVLPLLLELPLRLPRAVPRAAGLRGSLVLAATAAHHAAERQTPWADCPQALQGWQADLASAAEELALLVGRWCSAAGARAPAPKVVLPAMQVKQCSDVQSQGAGCLRALMPCIRSSAGLRLAHTAAA